VTPGGKVSTFSATGDGPNGLAVGPDGAFYLCNNGGSRYVEGTSMGQGPHGGVMAGERGRREGARGRGER
jgi:gluconolactonase